MVAGSTFALSAGLSSLNLLLLLFVQLVSNLCFVAASDHVSTEQFGFLPASSSDFRRPEFKPKVFDLSTQLHTNQQEMSPSMVGFYKREGYSVMNRLAPVEVIKYHGEHIVTNGHHRIAAARQMGKKKMTVNYADLDQ